MQGISDPPRNDCPVGPARGPALIVSGLGVIGLVAAFANGLPLLVQTVIAMAVLALCAHSLRRLLSPPIAGLKFDGRQLRIREATGARFSVELLGAPFVSPFYVGFRCRQEGRSLPRSFAIFREQMNPTDFRRLCVTLRQRGEE